MRRLSAAVTCLALVPVLGGLAACSTSDGTPTATTSTSPVTKQAGAADAATELGPGKLATFVLEGVLQGVGAQGYSFLSDLLTGDSNGVSEKATADELVKIETQLQRITTRLDTIDSDLNSIKGQLADIVLSDKLQDMHDWNVDMTVLYKEYFLPISYAAKDVSAVQAQIRAYQQAHCPATGTATATSSPTATGTPTTDPCASVPVSPDLQTQLEASVSKLNGIKSHFDDQFSHVYKPYSVLVDQHDSLYPKDPNIPSVLKLFGQRLETKGYATWTDSQRLHQMYLALSDQEALTALLIFEHDKMFGVDAVTQQRHKDDYGRYNKIEAANLATEIPWGQIKVGTQMYRADVAYDPGARQTLGQTPKPWLPISPEGHQLGSWDAAWVLGTPSNAGWTLPTDAQLTALYDGTKSAPADPESTHLGSIWKNTGRGDVYEENMAWTWGRKWFWSKDTSQSNPMTCTVAQSHEVTRTYTLHHAAYMAGATEVQVQGQPGRIPDNTSANTEVGCDDTLNRLYDNDAYAASVTLVQPIPANVDYMAERSIALPAPTDTPTTGS